MESRNRIRFVMAIHNHQPIGNFDDVIENACKDSYTPFLDVLEEYPQIPFALHTSGSLLEWLVDHRPDYVARVKQLVDAGRVEILGGGFYEPILAMIPARDRVGQIKTYSDYLKNLFGCEVRGMWVPERVWEQSFTSDIAQAGIEYTILDDFHFRKAGLRQNELFGYYLTEDEGNILRVFPGSEPLRYFIPFQDVDKLVEYLREVHSKTPNALVVFADDGEKFGTWPDTKKHVYENGWLRKFLDALVQNQDWLQVVTPSQAIAATAPIETVYLPDCSYREMTEWVLPPARQEEYVHWWHKISDDEGLATLKDFIKGGFWRNYKVRYPETQEMYARMMAISRALEDLRAADPKSEEDAAIVAARVALYRGQCNCPYWHGAFGGLYLPHLRNATFTELIKADNLLSEKLHPEGAFVQLEQRDFNFDSHSEVKLENDKLVAFFQPGCGGMMYELDVRRVAMNIGASLSRRQEAYHEKVLHASQHAQENFGSIHDRVVFKQEGLDKMLTYDTYPRKSLIDHAWKPETLLADLVSGAAENLVDLAHAEYSFSVEQSKETATLSLRSASIDFLEVTKEVTVRADDSKMSIRIRTRNNSNAAIRYGLEFNFAALAAGPEDRYYMSDEKKLARLGQQLELSEAKNIHLVDEWIGIDVGLASDKSLQFWSYPIQTVSQSEGGFELVHQSVCVIATSVLPPLADWECAFELSLDTTIAETRSAKQD